MSIEILVAKGLSCGEKSLGIDVNQAFTLLRDQARNRNQRLSDLARGFVDGSQAISAPSGSPRTSRSGRIRQP